MSVTHIPQVAIETRHLYKRFGDVTALDDINLRIAQGEFVAIMGASGSGKTTLMNILTCLDTATEGQVFLDGTDAAALDEEGRRRFRAEKIGLVFQQFHLIPFLTALENIMLAQHYHTPGYFQITATPHLAVYDPTVQFEFWFSEKRIADIRQVETSARYLGTALYWIAASINIKPGHDYYFYVRSVNTVGKSAFVEAVDQPSDDASGYLDFFKGEIGKTHLAQELWTQIDNGQLAPDLTEIRTSITDVSNEITQTVNKKLEDQSAAIQQIQKVQVDTNNNLNSMWAVKLQQMQDGRLYIAGIGAGIENTPDGMQSQVLLAADRIAMINPANGNTKPMFVGQGDQIFMNEVFLKRLTAPTITSGGNPPAFSLTSDGRLTAKNADISGSVNANSGTLNNVTINQNCTIKGMLEATQVRGDFVKAVSKAFPKKVGTWGNTETPNGTVTVTISDDHNFDRQIIIPPIIFNGIAYDDPGSGNNPGGTRYTGYGFEVRKNGVLIASRETKGAIPGSYSAVIDMPSGRGSVTLEFKIFQKGNQGAGNITDCTVIVTKKAASGISIR